MRKTLERIALDQALAEGVVQHRDHRRHSPAIRPRPLLGLGLVKHCNERGPEKHFQRPMAEIAVS